MLQYEQDKNTRQCRSCRLEKNRSWIAKHRCTRSLMEAFTCIHSTKDPLDSEVYAALAWLNGQISNARANVFMVRGSHYIFIHKGGVATFDLDDERHTVYVHGYAKKPTHAGRTGITAFFYAVRMAGYLQVELHSLSSVRVQWFWYRQGFRTVQLDQHRPGLVGMRLQLPS